MKNTFVSKKARPTIIPAWLLQLEDDYQLDVSSFPNRISLKIGLNRSRLKQLSFEMGKYGYTYEGPLLAFLRIGEGNEVC